MGQQNHKKNHASVVGRPAGGNGDVCHAWGGQKTGQQETSWVGNRSRGRKSGWRENKLTPEARGTVQKREEQVDGKRTALGQRPFKPGPNRGAEYLRRSGHSGEGNTGPDGG